MIRIPETSELLGSIIAGRYRLDAVIGEGGMGSVFRATQLGMDRQVAVKVLRFSALLEPAQVVRARTRFDREARALSRLSHPHTIRVYDYGHTEQGNPYLVTELLLGRSLDDIVDKDGAMEALHSARIAVRILKSLAEAHEEGLVALGWHGGSIQCYDAVPVK